MMHFDDPYEEDKLVSNNNESKRAESLELALI
jgi:hypothetical protein